MWSKCSMDWMRGLRSNVCIYKLDIRIGISHACESEWLLSCLVSPFSWVSIAAASHTAAAPKWRVIVAVRVTRVCQLFKPLSHSSNSSGKKPKPRTRTSPPSYFGRTEKVQLYCRHWGYTQKRVGQEECGDNLCFFWHVKLILLGPYNWNGLYTPKSFRQISKLRKTTETAVFSVKTVSMTQRFLIWTGLQFKKSVLNQLEFIEIRGLGVR